MFIEDLARGGFVPLQDFRPNVPLELRIVKYAARVTSRSIKGHYGTSASPDNQKLTEGDILGATIWFPAETHGRPIPGWSYAWPAMVVDTPQPQGEGTRTRSANKLKPKLLPVKTTAWDPDSRFEQIDAALPPGFDDVPKDTPGIVVGGTNERAQESLFFPLTNAPLVAVNRAGDPGKGTWVYDLDANNKLSKTYRARLQSMMRVVRPGTDSLAWQLGQSGLDSLDGYGLVHGDASPALQQLQSAPRDAREKQPGDDDPTRTRTRVPNQPPGGSQDLGGTRTRPQNGGTQTRSAVLAYAAAKKGGPFDLGSHGDQHNWGTSKDGEPINAVHLPTEALFRGSGGDAPLPFEPVAYSNPSPQPLRVRAHLTYDANAVHNWAYGSRSGQGLWRLEAEAVAYVPPERTWTPQPPPIPPLPPPPGGGGETKELPPPTGRCDTINDGTKVLIAGTPWAATGGTRTRADTTGSDGFQEATEGNTVGGTRTRGQGKEGSDETSGQKPREHPSGYPGPATAGTVTSDDLKDLINKTFADPAGASGGPAGTTGGSGGGSLAEALLEWTRSQTRLYGAPLPDPPSFPQKKLLSDEHMKAFGVHSQDTNGRPDRMVTFPMTLAISGLVLRPQLVSPAASDMRFNPKPKAHQLVALERTPAVGRFEAFAPSEAGEFITNKQQGRANRFPGGTANGGWVFLPPELDIADIDSDFAPAGVVPSTAQLSMVKSKLALAQSLDQTTGAAKTGFVASPTAGGNLQLQGHGSDAQETGFHILGQNGSYNGVNADGQTQFSTNGGALTIPDNGFLHDAPAAGYGRFFVSGGIPYFVDENGNYYDLSQGGGGMALKDLGAGQPGFLSGNILYMGVLGAMEVAATSVLSGPIIGPRGNRSALSAVLDASTVPSSVILVSGFREIPSSMTGWEASAIQVETNVLNWTDSGAGAGNTVVTFTLLVRDLTLSLLSSQSRSVTYPNVDNTSFVNLTVPSSDLSGLAAGDAFLITVIAQITTTGRYRPNIAFGRIAFNWT